jgi:hypothetical protein
LAGTYLYRRFLHFLTAPIQVENCHCQNIPAEVNSQVWSRISTRNGVKRTFKNHNFSVCFPFQAFRFADSHAPLNKMHETNGLTGGRVSVRPFASFSKFHLVYIN